MAPLFHDGPTIRTLSPKPDVILWYARISDIIHSEFSPVFRKNHDHNFRVRADETFKKEDFNTSFLDHYELDTINRFRALKKQIEWICGRYLMKRMIQKTFDWSVPLDGITLSYQAEGAPFLTHHPDIPVSLSHSNDYTVAACSKNKDQTIGVDIEKIRPMPDQGFLKTAFTKNEILFLKNDASLVFKNWTIKEAYLKYIKKGFNESLHSVEVIKGDILHKRKKTDVDIASMAVVGGYILSLVSD